MPDRFTRFGNAARQKLDDLVRLGRVPGLQYLVVSSDQTIFEYAGGLADIGTGRAMSSDSTLMAYSMSKTITAAAILQLVGRQVVKLDVPLSTYVPDHPYGARVTVRQVLSHTAGIPNPLPLRWAHPALQHGQFDERAELRRILARHHKLTAPPGSRFRYANIGYWLLGALVEEVSGTSFPDYVRRQVLEPLSITAADLGYTVSDPSVHAKGYLERYSMLNVLKGLLIDRDLIGETEGRWVNIRDHYVSGSAVGGLVGSARGFGKFLQDQLRVHSALFDDDAIRRLFYEVQRTSTGASVPMTLGWHVGATKQARYFYKEGGGGGFHSMMRLYPGAGIGSVVLTNATAFDVKSFLDHTDGQFLGARSESVPATLSAIIQPGQQ